MTTLTIASGQLTELLERLFRAGMRPPTFDGLPSDPVRVLTWMPDLTAAEADILRAVNGAVTLTSEERAAIESDVVGLRTYQGLASPTLAQTVSAVKAQSRILRALLRD